MQDDDWMFPRQLHSVHAEGSDERPEAQNLLQIDSESLRRRNERKQKLSLHPHATTAGENPWVDFDRSIARLPAFSDQMWTLGDTARWVTERTPEAVDGLSIDEEKLFEVLPEIHTAFSAGEVSVFANTSHDPVPRELSAETWSVYQLVIEEKNGLIRIFPLNSSSSDYEQDLLNIRVKRADVLRRWPSFTTARSPIHPTTIGVENQCRRWLAEIMKAAPGRPKPKADVLNEALTKFPKLGKRGFDRAWSDAIRDANAEKWRAPGRRS